MRRASSGRNPTPGWPSHLVRPSGRGEEALARHWGERRWPGAERKGGDDATPTSALGLIIIVCRISPPCAPRTLPGDPALRRYSGNISATPSTPILR